MTIAAIRESLESLPITGAGHPGLVLQRYLKTQKEAGGASTDWDCHFEAVISGCDRAKTLYDALFRRWLKAFGTEEEDIPVIAKSFETEGRLVCGLGIASPVETGLALHHTYGIPFIPGSALKGVAAHYCHSRWGRENPDFLEGGTAYETLFGTTDDRGHLRFHDALPKGKTVRLHRDIMTPHHGDYYGEKGTKAPTDFDSPVPVSFLSVTGTFVVVLTCDDPSDEGRRWLHLAMELVEESLATTGIGGKTRSGYGRMIAREAVTLPKPDLYAEGNVIVAERIEQGTARGGKKNKKAKERAEFLSLSEEKHLIIVRDLDSVKDIAIGDEVTLRITQNSLNQQNPYLEAEVE
ncbi:type III-B CRISPR module RAMP protein Cmr6 [Aminithiophilus ramosus]|uniref:Type III-B CRISPR module RAMP protein Cmr6 n=2 Tax=Synergistales TaxID=649776 RepID=A0A9Q7AF74_9BACT|nr:type III-B CRISPR module RAMP protein Cmr6 [Aminithiophilus ramosus]QTX32134.1 type III-B CRISPR module RAMP protein Cmr6 [Aminithiophilus ramosus]QVL36002.1 type III-B CRISPR module RAMP protein Cmr6 [Synergistota bacterium]